MKKKVCILAAGITRKVGAFSGHINKAILPVNNKGVISHIIDKFSKDTEFVIAVGHRKKSIIDYVNIAHPKSNITFVEVEKYMGEGAGPATSLLECKDHLQSPFILTTVDTIVVEDIPSPTKNWIGVAKVDNPEQYCTVKIDQGLISEITVKQKTANKYAFIGLAGIKNYKDFFLAIQLNQLKIEGEVQLSNGLKALLPNLNAKEFTWFDTGSEKGFRQANEYFTPKGFDFSKTNEFLYFINDHVIKFFADEEITKKRVERAKVLNPLTPKIKHYIDNFYSYKAIPGTILYDKLEKTIVNSFFSWAQKNLFTKIELTSKECVEFDVACNKFYKHKSLSRIDTFFAKTGLADEPAIINGKPIPSLHLLLEKINWKELCAGIPSKFHGDLQFDNIILNKGTKDEFTLLDWRQEFGGLTKYGDVYYDLAKLYGGLTIDYRSIKNNDFFFSKENKNITVKIPDDEKLHIVRKEFEKFIEKEGYDMKKIKILRALIFLNMSPLHNEPFDELLYQLGRKLLYEALDLSDLEKESGKKPTKKIKYSGPLFCVGPMSKNFVDVVIDYSSSKKIPLNLIASRSQVETAALGGGYANNWTTEDFATYVKDRVKEKHAQIKICRDHGGPWLGQDEKGLSEKFAMLAAKASYEADIASGFDMIHIDTSRCLGAFNMEEALSRAFELLLFCEEKAKQYGRTLEYEVGTEDADGGIVEPKEFEYFLSKIVEFCEENNIPKPTYIVGRTGTYVRETKQDGWFEFDNTVELVEIANKYGVGIKEHNVDYDAHESLRLRTKAGIAAMNVAPEFGVIETLSVMRYCKEINREDVYDRFVNLAYDSKKWKKWLKMPDMTTREEKAIIAGHYVFGSPEFQELKKELGLEIDNIICRDLTAKLDWYIKHINHHHILQQERWGEFSEFAKVRER